MGRIARLQLFHCVHCHNDGDLLEGDGQTHITNISVQGNRLCLEEIRVEVDTEVVQKFVGLHVPRCFAAAMSKHVTKAFRAQYHVCWS